MQTNINNLHISIIKLHFQKNAEIFFYCFFFSLELFKYSCMHWKSLVIIAVFRMVINKIRKTQITTYRYRFGCFFFLLMFKSL